MFQLRLFITSAILSTILYAQGRSSTQRVISLQGLKPSPKRCPLGVNAQFLDDSTLLISNPICTKNGRGYASSNQHALASLDGNISNSIELGEGSRYAYIGPPGYIFFPADHDGWLIYDTSLQPKWRVPIPSNEYPGSVVLSPSRTAAAISSQAVGDYERYRWQLFAGNPPTKVGEFVGPLPFPGITDTGAVAKTALPSKSKSTGLEPVPGELWFFDANYQLTRRTATGDTVLPGAVWLAPNSREAWCSESFSMSHPRRILTYCDTTIFIPNAFALVMHTAVSAHLRYIVYDEAGNILTQGTYGYGSPPSLSPNGHLLAVGQRRSVVLYDLP